MRNQVYLGSKGSPDRDFFFSFDTHLGYNLEKPTDFRSTGAYQS